MFLLLPFWMFPRFGSAILKNHLNPLAVRFCPAAKNTNLYCLISLITFNNACYLLAYDVRPITEMADTVEGGILCELPELCSP